MDPEAHGYLHGKGCNPVEGNKPTTRSSAPCVSRWIIHGHARLVTGACVQDLPEAEPTYGKAAVRNEDSKQ